MRAPAPPRPSDLRRFGTPSLATLDADDLWLPHKMQTQLSRLRDYPALNGVFANWDTFNQKGRIGIPAPGWSRSTLAIRTADAIRVGAIVDQPGSLGDMVDWIARAREMGLQFEMLSEVLALRRIRPGSLSYARDPVKNRGYASVAWLALKRRRQREAKS